MPFDNPYFPTQFDIGTPGGSHIHFANDGSMTLFGTDGTTIKSQLLSTGFTFFGTDGGSIAIKPGAAGGNPAEIVFNVSGMPNPGILVYGTASAGAQGVASLRSPAVGGGWAELSLLSDSALPSIPSTALLFTGLSRIQLDGNKPGGGAASHGLLTLTVADDSGLQQSITWDSTTLDLHGNSIATGFVSVTGGGVGAPGGSYLASDPSSSPSGLVVQQADGVVGFAVKRHSATASSPLFEALTETGTVLVDIDANGGCDFKQIRLQASGSAVIQVGSIGGIAPNPPAGTVYLYFSGANLRCRFPSGADTVLA